MRLEYFQMIDEISAFDREGETLKARALVPAQSPIFEGHFPGYPIMPGVLLIETMAQASGWLVLALNNLTQMPFLVGVKEGKLRTFVEPEKGLDVEASLVHGGSGFAITSARISIDGKRVCDATLTFKTMPFPAPELAEMMRERAAEFGLATEVE
jgi:3-hydroxyacyl-[acyl-carrier-protein] dehydratase